MNLGFKFFFSRLGHDLGRRLGPNLIGLNGAHGAGLGLEKEISLINGQGSGRKSSPGMKKPGQLSFLFLNWKKLTIPSFYPNNEICDS